MEKSYADTVIKNLSELTHGSLFTGIGGFEEGADLAGIETKWTCEIESYNRKIISKHWEKTKQYDDIRKMSNPGYVDIISGGFPCQDISVAGKMEGINGSQSSLWNEMHRICWEVRPKYIIIENSPALVIRGLESVLCDLSQIGYNAEWQCISNNSFGFPHKRERIYIIAYSDKIGSQGNFCEMGSFESVFKKWSPNPGYGYTCAEGILKIPAHCDIRNDDGFQNWTHRVAGVGNSVNPILANYLFECIKDFDKINNRQ